MKRRSSRVSWKCCKTFEERFLRKGFKDQISVIRILDSRREEFRLSKAYEQKVDVINVITAPEIEMLIIHSEGAYLRFSMNLRSVRKVLPKIQHRKQNLRIPERDFTRMILQVLLACLWKNI